jgi:hypothetical protein
MAWLIHPARGADWQATARALIAANPQCHVMMAPRYDGQDGPRFARLSALADSLNIPTIASAAPLLSPEQQEMAFALACQLIHCDRIVAPQEQQFLAVLAQQLQFTTARAEEILEVCDLLNRDFVSDQPV